MTQIKTLKGKVIANILSDGGRIGFVDDKGVLFMTFKVDKVFDGNGNLFDYNDLDESDFNARSAMLVEGKVFVLGRYDMHVTILQKWMEDYHKSEEQTDFMIEDQRIRFGYARRINGEWAFSESVNHDANYRSVDEVSSSCP